MRAFLIAAVLIVCPTLARGQVGGALPMSPEAARRVGLERMWFTQLSLDRSRSRVSGIHMHVSAIKSHTVFQVTHAGKRYVFSQRDRNAFGEEIGMDVARQQAEAKAAAIKADLEAAKNDAPAPQVETFVVPQITLYATSERGLVHAIDGETGRTLWSTSVGKPQYPTTAAGANEKYVGVCNGSTIYVMLASDGSVVWSRPAVGSPGAGPALTDELIFVPMVSGQVETFFVDEPRRPPSNYKSFGRTMIQPVVSSNSVAWPTDGGSLYVALAHGQGLRFRMQATDAINSAPAFLAPNQIFASSIDGYIYCLSEEKGNVLWRFTTGESMTHSPVPLGDKVFAISEHGNLYAIDVASAVERWVTGGIRRFLAGNDKRIYCLDVRGNLVILDYAAGNRLGTIPVGTFDIPLLNNQTDRIILANSTGLIQCVRESNLPFPLVHYRIEPQTVAKTAVKPASKEGTEKTDSVPSSTDPFGTAPDPFAPAGAKPAAPPADDPFAPPKPAAPPAADPFANP